VRHVAGRKVESGNKPFVQLRRFLAAVLKAGRNLADVVRAAPERQPSAASVLVESQAAGEPRAEPRAKDIIPQLRGDRGNVDQMAHDGVILLGPGSAAELGPQRQVV
jgi:hypothetical protein